MGTADGADLGDERKTESSPAGRRTPYTPHAPIIEGRMTSPPARDAPTTRESAAGDGSRPHTPRAHHRRTIEATHTTTTETTS